MLVVMVVLGLLGVGVEVGVEAVVVVLLLKKGSGVEG